MYNTIVNPANNQYYSLNSKMGKTILKNYISVILHRGGSNQAEVAEYEQQTALDGSLSEEQQTALKKILDYFAGGLDYDALIKKLNEDELFKKSILLKYDKIPKSEVQDIKEKFKDKTGLSYEAVSSYLKALQNKKQYDDIVVILNKYKNDMKKKNIYCRERQRIKNILQAHKKKFNEETKDNIFNNGLVFDSILKELEKKEEAKAAAEAEEAIVAMCYKKV